MPARRAVGVLGGTFDPIHLGHLVAASEVADRLGLAEVVFVPAGRPWQKAGTPVTAAKHRWAMTCAAVAGDARFTASRVDLDRAGPTYTVDTLRDLRAQLPPDTDLYFITGADTLGQLRTWRQPNEVLRLARLVGVTRPGHRLQPEDVVPAPILVDIPGIDVSATDLRERMARGRTIRYLVPDPVADYIAGHGLYRDAS